MSLVWTQSMGLPTYCLAVTSSEKARHAITVIVCNSGDSVVIGDRNIFRGPHIVQPEDGGVNLDMRELDEALEAAKEVEHLVRGWRPGLSQGSR